MRSQRSRRLRQRVRLVVLLVTLLLFPVVLMYLSPVLIVEAAARGVINGSFIVFAGLFAVALFLGRAWCGWACPGSGLQDICGMAVGRRASLRGDVVKWVIWVPWVAAIALAAVRVGGYTRVDPRYMTADGLSVVDVATYAIYYSVLALIVILALAAGRRGFCHHVCWMAPFMILGRRLRNVGRWPGLQLRGDSSACIECGRCTHECPMSLPVAEMVQAGHVEHPECILCCTCVDVCPKGAVILEFSSRPHATRGRPRGRA